MLGLFTLLAVAAALILFGGTWLIVHGMQHPPRRTLASALAYGRPGEPSDIGLDAEEVRFDLPAGHHTPGWVVKGQKPDGPTVVITHGFGVSRRWSLTWAQHVVRHAREVVVYDLRGHGRSTARRCRGGAVEPRELLAVLDQLDARAGEAGRYVLMGLSMGAGISIAAASLDPGGRVLGVIADGPFRGRTEPLRGVLRQKRYPVYPFVWLVELYLRLTMGPAQRYDRVELASRLACPLLVLHGRLDPVCPAASARAIAEAAPHGRIVWFDQGGHLDLFELDPPRYDDALAGFFAGLAPARP